jgi:hypothetical protein
LLLLASYGTKCHIYHKEQVVGHVIEISDELFARMQAFAAPLVDTPETIMGRALAALEAGSSVGPQDVGSRIKSFNPAAPPSLSHTTPRRMVLAGRALPRSETYWNSLMLAVIRKARDDGLTPTQIQATLSVNSVVGDKDFHGYKFLPDVGISVQGQDANSAWRQTYDLATTIGVAVEVEFVWQETPKAAMPGVAGRFTVGGRECD